MTGPVRSVLAVSCSETFDAYRARRALNYSVLKHLADSPLHFAHALREPQADRVELMLGRLGHAAILEPDRLALDFASWEGRRQPGRFPEETTLHLPGWAYATPEDQSETDPAHGITIGGAA